MGSQYCSQPRILVGSWALGLFLVASCVLPGQSFASKNDCQRLRSQALQEEGFIIWVHEGQSIMLDCQANVSSGSLSSVWYALDKQVHSLGEHIHTEQKQSLLLGHNLDQSMLHLNTQLVIKNASTTDTGMYYCVIYNNHSYQETTYHLVIVESTAVSLGNLHEERIAGILQRIQQTKLSNASASHFCLTNYTPVMVSCLSISGSEVQWYRDGNELPGNDSCTAHSWVSESIRLRQHPKYANWSQANETSKLVVQLQQHVFTVRFGETCQHSAWNDTVTLSCRIINHHGNKTDVWLTRNFSVDLSLDTASLKNTQLVSDSLAVSMQLVQNGSQHTLQSVCSSQHASQLWAQWELDGQPVYRLATTTLPSVTVCQIGRTQQRLTVLTSEAGFFEGGENGTLELVCKEKLETRGGVLACDSRAGMQSPTSSTTSSAGTTVATDNKEQGVRDEGLESDDIIAILILALALLISVTTVIAVYKNRQRNILIRRIRIRHCYLPSHASETNISIAY